MAQQFRLVKYSNLPRKPLLVDHRGTYYPLYWGFVQNPTEESRSKPRSLIEWERDSVSTAQLAIASNGWMIVVLTISDNHIPKKSLIAYLMLIGGDWNIFSLFSQWYNWNNHHPNWLSYHHIPLNLVGLEHLLDFFHIFISSL